MSVMVILFLATTTVVGAEGGRDRPRQGRLAEPGDPASRPDKPTGRRTLADAKQHETKLLEWVKQVRPEHHKRLVVLKKTNPRLYWWAMRETIKLHRRTKSMPADLRDLMFQQQDLRLRAWRLAKEFRSTDSEQDKDRLRADLREVLARMFAVQQKVRLRRLAMLEQRIKLIRANLEQRAKRRDQIIEKKLQRMLNAPQKPRRRGPGRPTTKPAD